MANVVEILIRANDQASQKIQGVEGVLGRLRGAITAAGGASVILGTIATALTAAGAAALKSATDYAAAREQLDRLAENTSLTARELQVIRAVVEDAGGEFGGFAAAISWFNRKLAEGHPLIKQLELDTSSTSTAFFDLVEIIAKTTDVQKRALVMQELLGRGSKEMAADLKALHENYARTGAELEKTGKIMSDEAAPAARELDAEIERLGKNWGGAMNKIAEATLPVATQVIQALNAMFAAARGEGRGGGGLGFLGAFRGAGAAIGGSITSVPGAGGSKADPLAGVTVGADGEARAKRLEELRAVLRGTGMDAARVLATLEEIERGDKLEAILKKLDEARPLAQRLEEAAAFTAPTLERRGLGPSSPSVAVDELQKVPEAQLDALTQVRAHWSDFVAEVLSASSILDESLSGLWNGLQNGFGTVFRNLTNETQTFAGAMRTIFEALVQEILAMLARIAAAKAFSFLLGLVLGGPAGAAAGASAGGGGFGIIGGTSAARAPVAAAGNTYVTIQSLDARTSLEQIVSPFGGIRMAELRAAEAFA